MRDVTGFYVLLGGLALWASFGPGAGLYTALFHTIPLMVFLRAPGRLGILVVLCLATLAGIGLAEWRRRGQFRGAIAERRSQFVAWGPLRLVLSVLLPAVVYVEGVQLIGIYVASAIYVAVFMRWLGKYRWPRSVAAGAGVSVVLFLMFELWFKVSLFKGAYDPSGVARLLSVARRNLSKISARSEARDRDRRPPPRLRGPQI